MAETMAEVIADGADVTTTLTDIEEHQLLKCEQIIKSGLGTFLNVGQSLAMIHDNRLYRANYKSFEKYCREVWDLGKSTAYQKMDGYRVVNLLESKTSAIADVFDKNHQVEETEVCISLNEAQTRPLTKLKNPEDQIKAWDIVLKRLNAGDKLTAALIAKAVKEVRGEVVRTRVADTKQKVESTQLVSTQFKKQYQVLLDIIFGEKSTGWQTTKRTEVVKYLKELIKLAESDD